jgi:hypothetical protein
MTRLRTSRHVSPRSPRWVPQRLPGHSDTTTTASPGRHANGSPVARTRAPAPRRDGEMSRLALRTVFRHVVAFPGESLLYSGRSGWLRHRRDKVMLRFPLVTARR